MQVDARSEPTSDAAFERRTFKCSTCPQVAQRFVFSRVKMPVSHLPVITTPTHNLWKGVVAPNAWGKAIETLRSRQTDLKERAAAAKIAGWTKAVEKVRSRQTALMARAAVAKTSDAGGHRDVAAGNLGAPTAAPVTQPKPEKL